MGIRTILQALMYPYHTTVYSNMQEVISIFLSEVLEIYYNDEQDKPLLSFLEFIGPGVHVDEISNTMCRLYFKNMPATSKQMYYPELLKFLRWAYQANYTRRNLAYRIKLS